jgi:retinol dehydrogenase-12
MASIAAEKGATSPVAVVTGASGGIGRWIALGLARAGMHVVLVVRDRERGEAARDWIASEVPGACTELVLADLSSLAQVRRAGEEIRGRHPRLALLVNNAGVYRPRREMTSEGQERVLAVNHLAPFVLTRVLLNALRAGAPARIVNVGSSMSERVGIAPDDLPLRRGWNMVRAYGRSKLAMLMATMELARTLEGSGVTANVVHPGSVATGIVRGTGIAGWTWGLLTPFLLSEEKGAAAPLHVALAPDLAGVTGLYFRGMRPAAPNRRALDGDLRHVVCRRTEELVAAQSPRARPTPEKAH